MKLSHTMGLSALAMMAASTGVASADVAAKNTYYIPGAVVVSVSDVAGGAICKGFGYTVGTLTNAWVIYPGAGAAGLTLISPATSPTATTTGSQTAYTCRAGDYTTTVSKTGVTSYKWTNYTTPLGGISGQTVPMSCFADTAAGAGNGGKLITPGKLPVAKANVVFNLAATANGAKTLTGALTETVSVGTASCTFEADGTWFAR